MKSNSSLSKLFPVMLCFFAMGFVDLVGIASNYVKADLGLTDSQANIFPSLVFFWFLIFSVPTGMLMSRIGQKKTVLLSLVVTFASLLLLGNGSLRDMKDYNNHAISKKQQEKFLEMGENLNIFYSLDEKEKDTSKATDDLTTLSSNSARGPQTSYMPCKAAVVIEGNEIYIPISQAQDLCREIGEPSEISKVYLKINGKNNLENAKKMLSGI